MVVALADVISPSVLEVLAETFAKVSKTENLPAQHKTFRQEKENTFEHITPTANDPMDRDITFKELLTAVISIPKTRKASGSDPISYGMIKQFLHCTLIHLRASSDVKIK
jgi:hypothetical protein